MLTGQAMPIVEAGKATHTTLDCTNLQASLRFYHEVLGLRVEQNGPKSGLLSGTNLEMYAAVIEVPRLSPQPLLNYYARPVRDAATVDVVSDRLRTVQMQYGIRQMTAPAREDPAHFWVGTYGF